MANCINISKMRSSCLFSFATLVIFGNLWEQSSGQNACSNPNGRGGSCVSIYDCSSLLSVIQKQPLPDIDRQFILQSQCTNGAGQQPYVCCTPDVGYTSGSSSSTTGSPRSIPSGNGEGSALPTPPRCGQAPDTGKIYNGNDTLLNEFAWMALLEYVQPSGSRILNCGGSLINQRYVLTAAHCVTGAILREVGRLDRVRLGEHDLTKDVDCMENTCADPVLNVRVAEAIPHPDYSDSSQNRQNDIALVRLDSVVPYSDSIKPVCLPSALGLRATAEPGTNLIVAGWGRTLTARQSNIKQKLFIPVNDHQECVQKFAAKRIQLIPSQICVGGRFVEDSCDGDSGGPLMRWQGFYVLEGIVSFGNRCGLEGWPGVYTKVLDYEPWIRNTIRS